MKIITSEAVFRGHPDKVCDQISDAILDECLKQDKLSRVAIECLIKDNMIIIAGEVTSKANIDYSQIAKDVLIDIGIDGEFDIVTKISKQSNDIALGVDTEGAGDQGIMYGYACSETKELMPLPIVLSRNIAMKMDKLTKPMKDFFSVDGKCQVSVLYDELDNPIKVTSVIVSKQTKPYIDRDFYEGFIIDECIEEVIPKELLNEDTQILINPTGEFVSGGSFADCGLTGRKIMVDTYGGVGHHGGGAFSGKDATKVDRLGAYYARYVAKNIVASGIAKKCEVQVAYAIGITKPVALYVEAFNTSKYTNDELTEMVNSVFNFTPASIRKAFNYLRVNYYELASYGHVGRLDVRVPWEITDKCTSIKNYFKN